MIDIYGIKNCSTMKKAMDWLDEYSIEFAFHNYKTQAVDEAVIRLAISQHGWETVINRRGTTWRKLSDDQKGSMNSEAAVQIAIENPSIIKRPLLVYKQDVYLGFKADAYSSIFGKD
ncbi:MAG: ArsC family reductase [Robiginitomaculum sp.]|nr:ArsC family reductase [Robiginitomaculum sp.]